MYDPDLPRLLREHREQFDVDCDIHHGCSCGWEPKDYRFSEYDGNDFFYRARDEYTLHLTEVLVGAGHAS